MRINTSFYHLNGISNSKKYEHPFEEKNWITPENKNRLTIEERLLEKDGFHFSINNEDFTLWNGEKRTYIPFLGIRMKLVDGEDLIPQIERNKQLFKERFSTIFGKLSLLKMTEDEIVDLIFPYILEYRKSGRTGRTLYIEGDIKDGEITAISVSNYIYCNVGRYKNLVNFYYEETNEKEKIGKLLKDFSVKGYELLNFEDKIKS